MKFTAPTIAIANHIVMTEIRVVRKCMELLITKLHWCLID